MKCHLIVTTPLFSVATVLRALLMLLLHMIPPNTLYESWTFLMRILVTPEG
jgi:hypothetical protein